MSAFCARLAARCARSQGSLQQAESALVGAWRCQGSARGLVSSSGSSWLPAAAQQAPRGQSWSAQLWPRQLQQAHQQHQQQQAHQQARRIATSAPASTHCDCPTLGGPTPDVVTIEYDEAEVDRFIALADAIEAAFPAMVVEGNAAAPGRPGAFEVTGGSGQLLFSRLGSGGWPDEAALLDALAAACPAQQAEA